MYEKNPGVNKETPSLTQSTQTPKMYKKSSKVNKEIPKYLSFERQKVTINKRMYEFYKEIENLIFRERMYVQINFMDECQPLDCKHLKSNENFLITG